MLRFFFKLSEIGLHMLAPCLSVVSNCNIGLTKLCRLLNYLFFNWIPVIFKFSHGERVYYSWRHVVYFTVKYKILRKKMCRDFRSVEYFTNSRNPFKYQTCSSSASMGMELFSPPRKDISLSTFLSLSQSMGLWVKIYFLFLSCICQG